MGPEKNLSDLEEKIRSIESENLIEIITTSYLCTRLADRLPPEKTEFAKDMHVAFIILKEYLENNKRGSVLRILQKVCENMSEFEKICGDY